MKKGRDGRQRSLVMIGGAGVLAEGVELRAWRKRAAW
jgi:hypothetical protein